jgi:hypothetical protein
LGDGSIGQGGASGFYIGHWGTADQLEFGVREPYRTRTRYQSPYLTELFF